MIRSRSTGRYIKKPLEIKPIAWAIVLITILIAYFGVNVGDALAASPEFHSPLASDYVTPSITPSPTMPAPTSIVTVSPEPSPAVEDGSERIQMNEQAPIEDVKAYIASKDWPVETALRISFCESGYRSNAIGDVNLPDGGPASFGVFQIRAFANRPSAEELLDYRTNIDWAYGMWKAQGNFSAWTCK